MDKNGIFVFLVLALFVPDAANASLFWRSRMLVDAAAKDNSTATQSSPLPSPVPDGKPTRPEKSNQRSDESQLPSISSTPDSNGSNKSDSLRPPLQHPSDNEKNDTQVPRSTEPASPPPENQIDSMEHAKGSSKTKPLNTPPPNKAENEKNKDESSKTEPANPPPVKSQDKKNDDNGNPQTGSSETCTGVSNRCRDEKKLVACTLNAKSGSSEWLILVQNEGENSLKVNIFLPTSVRNPLKELTLTKHHGKRVNIPVSGDADNKIILDAGNGECVLHMDRLVSEDGILFHFPSYEKVVTPINGAYLFVISVVVFGGTWACCLFRKRRRQDGIPYQELEMGASEAPSVLDVETAEGWDQGWDDDWDEDNAVKSPGGRHVRSISANGLTARSSNRDGWENDWDA